MIDEAPPRRTGPKPVTTLAELNALDQDEILRGYRAGFNDAAAFTERGRGYWHGYLNGLADSGRAQPSPEQMALAREHSNAARAA